MGTGVATAVRIVHRPISFLTRHCASRLEWLFPRKIPSKASTALATLHDITCLVQMYIVHIILSLSDAQHRICRHEILQPWPKPNMHEQMFTSQCNYRRVMSKKRNCSCCTFVGVLAHQSSRRSKQHCANLVSAKLKTKVRISKLQ